MEQFQPVLDFCTSNHGTQLIVISSIEVKGKTSYHSHFQQRSSFHVTSRPISVRTSAACFEQTVIKSQICEVFLPPSLYILYIFTLCPRATLAFQNTFLLYSSKLQDSIRSPETELTSLLHDSLE